MRRREDKTMRFTDGSLVEIRYPEDPKEPPNVVKWGPNGEERVLPTDINRPVKRGKK